MNHLPRFSERSARYDIPTGAYGVLELVGHEIPLFIGDRQVGVLFIDGTAHCSYENGWEVYRIDGVGGADIRSGETFESVRRYLDKVPHMVRHDYE